MPQTSPPETRFNRPLTFYLCATLGPWTAWLIAGWLSRQPGQITLNLVLVSAFAGLGLALPALISWALIRRDPVLRADLWQRLRLTPTARRYMALGAAIMLGSILAAQLISLAFGHSADQFLLSRSASFSAGILIGWVPLLLAPLAEELGWHGYGTDTLRRHMTLFRTSILFGVYWVLWHVPLAGIEGYYQANLVETGPLYTANFVLSLIPFVLLMNWLYYRSGRCIWVTVVFHLAANVFNELFRTHPDSKVIQTGLLLVLTTVVVIRERPLFFAPPRR